MRLAMVGCELVTLALLIDLLRQFNKPVTLAVAYAWHPLAVWEAANSGHVDALMVTLVMLGVWLLVRSPPPRGGLMIALARTREALRHRRVCRRAGGPGTGVCPRR